MTKKFIIETALPDNAIKLCENAKDRQLKVYYKDGCIYVEGELKDGDEKIVDENVKTICPYLCPCCGHCNFEG